MIDDGRHRRSRTRRPGSFTSRSTLRQRLKASRSVTGPKPSSDPAARQNAARRARSHSMERGRVLGGGGARRSGTGVSSSKITASGRRGRSTSSIRTDACGKEISDRELAWESVTTGNFSGFDLWLTEGARGRLRLETPCFARDRAQSALLPALDYGMRRFGPAASGLPPARQPQRAVALARSEVAIHAGRDNPILVCATLQDGHQAWSSPIYLVPEQA